MNITRSYAAKFRDLVLFATASRFFSNRMRAKVLKWYGWKIGEGSIIHWGISFTDIKISVGHQVLIARHVFIDGMGSVVIEDNVRIGPFCRILTTTHPIESSVPRRIPGKDIDCLTKIGYGSWIGVGATILPGVNIERGCVVAAGAVVVHNTEPDGLYAGVPARRVRDLPVDGAEVIGVV